MMHTALGRILVAGRWMRGLYGTVKAITFGWVLLCQPWPALDPESWSRWAATVEGVTITLVLASVGLCLARGLPVIVEFLSTQKAFSRTQIPVGSQ
jgi:CDP-diacylglycerol--glycerol-3-phosphate 3-phosphatidyltransferase